LNNKVKERNYHLESMFNTGLTLWHLMFNNYVRMNEIRLPFFNRDMSPLDDYVVIINIHADGPLGTYLTHKDYVEHFMRTDDFNECFTIKEYNEAKLKENHVEQIDLAKVDPNDKKWGRHRFGRNYFTEEQLAIRTKWTIVEDPETAKAVALTGEYDSRVPDRFIEDFKSGSYTEYNKIRVNSFDEGLDYLINFGL